MSETTHTPGPWTALPQCKTSGWVDIVRVDNGHESLPFAACKHFDEVANARLIAAAPDLLEALRNVADQARHPDYDWPVWLSREVSEAIAKAVQP